MGQRSPGAIYARGKAAEITRVKSRIAEVRRTAEQRDELAPLHVAPLPWQLAQQLLRNAYDVVFTVI